MSDEVERFRKFESLMLRYRRGTISERMLYKRVKAIFWDEVPNDFQKQY